MIRYLSLLLLLFTYGGMSNCQVPPDSAATQESLAAIERVCARYEQGQADRSNVMADFDSASASLARHGLAVLPLIKQKVVESPSECVRELLVKAAGIIISQHPDSIETRQLATFLMECLEKSLGTHDLVLATFRAVYGLRKDMVPVLLTGLRSESLATRSCSQELLIYVTGQTNLEFEDTADSATIDAGARRWSEWWLRAADSLQWDDESATLIPVSKQ
jgi:hypothetical protein